MRTYTVAILSELMRRKLQCRTNPLIQKEKNGPQSRFDEGRTS
jgi:hypothetical protein